MMWSYGWKLATLTSIMMCLSVMELVDLIWSILIAKIYRYLNSAWTCTYKINIFLYTCKHTHTTHTTQIKLHNTFTTTFYDCIVNGHYRQLSRWGDHGVFGWIMQRILFHSKLLHSQNSYYHIIIHKVSPQSEPDGNGAAEAGQGGKRISRMFSNNSVVKFFSGVKSLERTTIKLFHNVLAQTASSSLL